MYSAVYPRCFYVARSLLYRWCILKVDFCSKSKI